MKSASASLPLHSSLMLNTVQAFTLFKHCTAFSTAKGRSNILFLERLHSALALLHKYVIPRICPRKIDDVCNHPSSLSVLQALKYGCSWDLLSSSWPLLLVESILQCPYKRSVCPSLAFWTVPLYLPFVFHFLGWRWTSNALWLFCYVSLLHSVTSSMQPTVYEILICLLHVSRTNIFSINPSLCGAEQLVSRRVHFCLSLPWRMKRDKCGIDTLSGYKLQGNHNTVFSRYALWSGKYRKSG